MAPTRILGRGFLFEVLENMSDIQIAMIASILVLIASAVSIELAVSVAVIEIAFGVIAGNFLGLETTPWINFIAAFAGVILTFLAGAEVDTSEMTSRLTGAVLIGVASFALPFLALFASAYWVLDWSYKASLITGIALSATSIAIVYALLVETGLTSTSTGKFMMACTFVVNLCTASALSLFFIRPGLWTIGFAAVSMAIIFGVPRLYGPFAKRYGGRVSDPTLKLIFCSLFILMFFGEKSASHAILPAFLFGLAYSKKFAENRQEQQRLRVIVFSFLTPFFFLKSGLNVSLSTVGSSLGIVALLFIVKTAAKFASVYPLARRYMKRESAFATLLMSTGLTFDTITALYGFNQGIIDRKQFSIIIAAVILTAVVPTLIAQKFFSPKHLLAEISDSGSH